jgi:hypothetical protein
LGASDEVRARKVMVDADLNTADTAEVLFRPIRARAIKRVGFLMISPFDFATLMQVVLRFGDIGVHHSAIGNTGRNEGGSLTFGLSTVGNSIVVRVHWFVRNLLSRTQTLDVSQGYSAANQVMTE